LALCTVQEGGGTNIKVAEAYAFARPCVLSPHAFRGYEGALAAQDSPEPSAWVGATDVDIAAGCVRLLGDPELRDAMARRGRAACAERLSFATFAAIVARDVAPLLDPRGARIHGDAHDTRPS
jgi:glycosyltransferase involved in cell wall biosynthesis